MTVRIPSSRHARWMRRAISPRLAMRIFPNSWFGFLATMGDDGGRRGGKSGDHNERLPELHGLPVLGEHLLYDAALVGFDLVHQLHGFDNAQGIADLYGVADFDERLGARRSRTVERSDHRALDLVALGFGWLDRRGSRDWHRGARRSGHRNGADRIVAAPTAGAGAFATARVMRTRSSPSSISSSAMPELSTSSISVLSLRKSMASAGPAKRRTYRNDIVPCPDRSAFPDRPA